MTTKAQLVVKNHPTGLRYSIRMGQKGKGKEVWGCTSWDNPKATAQAEEWAWKYTRDHDIELVQETE